MTSTNPTPATEPTAEPAQEPTHVFDRAAVEGVLSRRFFVTPSFEIYGGVAGLYDYGPPGTAMLNNFQALWREHFVLQEEMHELDLTVVTPHPVLKTSGHVDRFCDWMVSDVVTGNIARADHLLKNTLEDRLESGTKPDAACADQKQKQKQKPLTDDEKAAYEDVLARLNDFNGADLGAAIRTHQVLSSAGNQVTEPVEFNLMFDAYVGPKRDIKAYLRPETAQGQFVNFNKLLEFNAGRMPFASASIGRSFRNEISPRSGLLRVREFLMAEIEHFVDPEDKSHAKFDAVADRVELDLLSASTQLAGSTATRRVAVGDAVRQRVIDNETLGYFLARVHLFLTQRLGIRREHLRFRQHMPSEMAHYAADCWDAELRCSYGWIECVGCADRAAYDLSRHSEATAKRLVVREPLSTPRERLALRVERRPFSIRFKAGAKQLETELARLPQECLARMRAELAAETGPATTKFVDCEGKETVLDNEVVRIETVRENVREYIPSVIEPSFGIGRIIYCLLEQSYYDRDATGGAAATSDSRNVLRLVPEIAPYKLLVAPLSGSAELRAHVHDVAARARRAGLATRTDDSGVSIGKRYARSDELGTPFAITVDFDTLKDQCVTLRERDSMSQVRVPLGDVVAVVASLCRFSDCGSEKKTWAQVCEEYGLV